MRARGISWGTIAARTPHTAADLARLPFDHPEIWEPLYKRAEKLALQEAEGQMFKALNVLLEGENVHAAEKAARELLLHRRHIERRRYQPPRHQGTKNLGGVNAAEAAHETRALSRDPASNLVPWCLGGEKETPEELRVPIIQLACCHAQGEDLLSTAAEIGHHHEEVERWPFLYVKAWDRHWRTARLETARFYAARAIRKLTDLAFDPDRNLAARAARTLLIHRRHMHWRLPERHLRCPTGGASLDETTPGGRNLTICQGGQKTSFENGTQNGERPAAEGACLPGSAGTTLTYPPSVAQVVVAIPGDGSLKVARRSGPARSCGTVRPSASRARDGP